MNQKIKALGLAFAAALALTAVVPVAAQAQFTFSPSPFTTLSGAQGATNQYTAGTGIGAINCSTASFHGISENLEEHSLVMSPTYNGCKDSLGRTVDITKNTASFEFTSGATAGETKGNVDIAGEIVWTITTPSFGHCTITVGSQTLNGVSYKGLGGTAGIEVTWNTKNIHSAIEGSGFACGSTTTTQTTGTYTGTTVVTAKDSSGTPWGLGAD